MRSETLDKLAAMCPFHIDVCSGPWLLDWDGAGHLLATDGRAMALVREPRPDDALHMPSRFSRIPSRLMAKVDRYLRMPVSGTRIRLDHVKEWAGPPAWTVDEPCGECEGRGTLACPECPSRNCPHQHDVAGRIKCDGCGASGRRPEFPRRYAKLGEKWFNANYVACLVETCPDEAVLVQSAHNEDDYHMAVLSGSGWRVWIMGCQPQNDEAKDAAASVLELEAR